MTAALGFLVTDTRDIYRRGVRHLAGRCEEMTVGFNVLKKFYKTAEMSLLF